MKQQNIIKGLIIASLAIYPVMAEKPAGVSSLETRVAAIENAQSVRREAEARKALNAFAAIAQEQGFYNAAKIVESGSNVSASEQSDLMDARALEFRGRDGLELVVVEDSKVIASTNPGRTGNHVSTQTWFSPTVQALHGNDSVVLTGISWQGKPVSAVAFSSSGVLKRDRTPGGEPKKFFAIAFIDN